ncbi:MAG: hypothetical protein AB1458_12085 [Bacteroidota bacterium]
MIIELLAAGGVGAFAYARHLKKEADTVQTEVRGAIHAIKLKGLDIRLDVKLKNPSKTDFKFSFPFVQLQSGKGGVIGTTQAVDEVVLLKAGEEKQLEPLFLHIPLGSVLKLGLEFLTNLKNGKAGFKLVAVTTTYAHLAFGVYKHKVSWKEEIVLLKEKT